MSETLNSRGLWIERVLGYRWAAAAGPPQTRSPEVAVKVAKSLILWNQTRAYVRQQVTALQQAIVAQTQDEPDFAEIEANLDNLDEVLEVLDDRLYEKLDALRESTDPRERETISAEARQLVAEYQNSVAGDALINAIDNNGFIALDVKRRVMATLSAIRATI